MESKKINLFIVDDDKSMVAALKQYLNKKFGDAIKISTFYNGDSCLQNINDQTDVVLLDYFLNGKNGVEVLKEIKAINPKTNVIMLSSHEDIGTAIESFQKGAIDYIVKGRNSWQKIRSVINRIAVKRYTLINDLKNSKLLVIFFIIALVITVVIIWKTFS